MQKMRDQERRSDSSRGSETIGPAIGDVGLSFGLRRVLYHMGQLHSASCKVIVTANQDRLETNLEYDKVASNLTMDSYAHRQPIQIKNRQVRSWAICVIVGKTQDRGLYTYLHVQCV